MGLRADKVIGDQLRTLRSERGLTQLQVAQMLDVPQSHISKLESGARSLYFSELFSYAQALDSTPDELFNHMTQAMIDRSKNA